MGAGLSCLTRAAEYTADVQGLVSIHQRIGRSPATQEQVNWAFNGITGKGSGFKFGRSQIPAPLIPTKPVEPGTDTFTLEMEVEVTSYDPTTKVASLNLTNGRRIYGAFERTWVDGNTRGGYVGFVYVNTSPEFETVVLDDAPRGPAKARIQFDVLGAHIEESLQYNEARQLFTIADHQLVATAPGNLIFLFDVRPRVVTLNIAGRAIRLVSQLISSKAVDIAPGDLDWIAGLGKPIKQRAPLKKIGLLEAKKLGEMLLSAAKAGDVDTMNQAIEEGAYLKERDEMNGQGVLSAAILGMSGGQEMNSKQLALVELLLSLGVSPNDGGEMNQPIYFVRDGECAKLLIRGGAIVNPALAQSQYTPLMRAAMDGRTEVVRVLLAAGADAQRVYRYPTDRAKTALDLAQDSKKFETAKLLSSFAASGKDALAWKTGQATPKAPEMPTATAADEATSQTFIAESAGLTAVKYTSLPIQPGVYFWIASERQWKPIPPANCMIRTPAAAVVGSIIGTLLSSGKTKFSPKPLLTVSAISAPLPIGTEFLGIRVGANGVMPQLALMKASSGGGFDAELVDNGSSKTFANPVSAPEAESGSSYQILHNTTLPAGTYVIADLRNAPNVTSWAFSNVTKL